MPNLCGFHALYNAIYQQQQSIAKFWRFYFQTVQQLEFHYPDQLKNYKELQRYHMDHVLRLLNVTAASFLYGFKIIQLSDEEIEQLQLYFNQLRANLIGKLVLLCGITIHWLAIVIEKYETHHTISIYDSQENDITLLIGGQIEILVQQKRDKQEQQLYQSYLADLRSVILMVQEFLNGKQIVDQQIENAISDLTQSYKQFVHSPNQLEDWLQNEYHPAVIKSMVVDLLKRHRRQCPPSLGWFLGIQHPSLEQLQDELRHLI